MRLLLLLCLICSMAFAQYGDALLAIVGEEVITLYDVQKLCAPEERRLAMQYKGDELEAKILELRTTALDTLIERELFFKEFNALGAKVPLSLVQDRVNKAMMEHANGNVARLEDMLQQEGMTMQDYKKRLEKDIAIELLVRDRTTRGNIVSDQEVNDYYEKQKDKMTTSAKWHIAVILLKKDGKYSDTDATFREIMGKLAEGIPFEELARTYSEGAKAENGGDQGWMTSMHEALMATVKTLKVGQTSSKLTDIGNGRYIVKLIDEVKGGVPELNDELREKLRFQLMKEEERRRYKNYVRELYMKYPVRRMDGNN